MTFGPIKHLEHLLQRRPPRAAEGRVLIVAGRPKHEPHLQRKALRGIQAGSHRLDAADDHFTVQVGTHARRAAGQHRGRKFHDVQLGFMNMDVLVDEPWGQVPAAGVDAHRRRTDRVVDLADRRETIAQDRDIRGVDLSGQYVDQLAPPHNEAGRPAPQSDIDELEPHRACVLRRCNPLHTRDRIPPPIKRSSPGAAPSPPDAQRSTTAVSLEVVGQPNCAAGAIN